LAVPLSNQQPPRRERYGDFVVASPKAERFGVASWLADTPLRHEVTLAAEPVSLEGTGQNSRTIGSIHRAAGIGLPMTGGPRSANGIGPTGPACARQIGPTSPDPRGREADLRRDPIQRA